MFGTESIYGRECVNASFPEDDESFVYLSVDFFKLQNIDVPHSSPPLTLPIEYLSLSNLRGN